MLVTGAPLTRLRHVGGACFLHDAPASSPDDRSLLEEHFKNACALLAREVESLPARGTTLSVEERRKLADSLASLLEIQELLRKG